MAYFSVILNTRPYLHVYNNFPIPVCMLITSLMSKCLLWLFGIDFQNIPLHSLFSCNLDLFLLLLTMLILLSISPLSRTLTYTFVGCYPLTPTSNKLPLILQLILVPIYHFGFPSYICMFFYRFPFRIRTIYICLYNCKFIQHNFKSILHYKVAIPTEKV